MQRFGALAAGALGSQRCIHFVIGSGLLLRLVLLALIVHWPLVADARAYHQMAGQLVRNESFAPFWPPGLPYYLSLFYRAFGEGEAVAKASMLLFYVAFSYVTYLFVQQAVARKAANLAVLVFSFYPNYVYHSLFPLTQLPITTCLAATVYLMWAICRRRSGPHGIALGAVLGYAALIRPSAILLTLFAPVALSAKTRSVWVPLAALSVSFAVTGAWLLKAHSMTGEFVMINYANSRNLFIGNNPYTPLYKTWWFGSHSAGEPEVPDDFVRMVRDIEQNPQHDQDELYRKIMLRHILSRPDLFLLRTMSRIRTYFAFDTQAAAALLKDYHANRQFGLIVLVADAVSYLCVMIMALLALFNVSSLQVTPLAVRIVLATAFAYAIPYFVGFSHPIYHFPVVPLFGVLACALAARLTEKPAAVVLQPIVASRNRMLALIITLAAFACIQIEWAAVMYSRV